MSKHAAPTTTLTPKERHPWRSEPVGNPAETAAGREPPSLSRTEPLSPDTRSRPRSLLLAGEVVELGADRPLGGRPQRPVDVGVDHGHDLGRRRRAGGEGTPDL